MTATKVVKSSQTIIPFAGISFINGEIFAYKSHFRKQAESLATYFPIQNFPKIFPSTSSVVISPVISPR
jgi:hypothetical protein